MRPRERRHRRTTDEGSGLISTIAGVLVFLVFLLFAVQLLLNLYATSATTAAAFDGARLVAGNRVDHGDPAAVEHARAEAERRVRSELGRFGSRVSFDWSQSDGDMVALRVRAATPRFLLPGFGGATAFDQIDRTVRVRVEEVR